jgi:hypothetical protein
MDAGKIGTRLARRGVRRLVRLSPGLDRRRRYEAFALSLFVALTPPQLASRDRALALRRVPTSAGASGIPVATEARVLFHSACERAAAKNVFCTRTSMPPASLTSYSDMIVSHNARPGSPRVRHPPAGAVFQMPTSRRNCFYPTFRSLADDLPSFPSQRLSLSPAPSRDPTSPACAGGLGGRRNRNRRSGAHQGSEPRNSHTAGRLMMRMALNLPLPSKGRETTSYDPNRRVAPYAP